MAEQLMLLNGSAMFSNSWKQELVITSDGVEGEVIVGLKRIKMHVPFDRIAQVNLVRGLFKADLEIVNKGGAENLKVRALDKGESEVAKRLIEEKMKESMFNKSAGNRAPQSLADELKKLSELREQGIITGGEFEAQKSRLLA